MDFKTSEIAFSEARISKYLKACSHDKAKALRLYRYNIRLSQHFYGMVGLFEVILRNAVNRHYSLQYEDPDWIVSQAENGKLLENDQELVRETETALKRRGIYSNDKMVSSFTFGFWTYLFTKNNYRRGGKTLLKIFPMKEKGKNQADIYADLTTIREFRNRIAHHEPICFDANGRISTFYARQHYSLISAYLHFLGFEPGSILRLAGIPDDLLQKIDSLA